MQIQQTRTRCICLNERSFQHFFLFRFRPVNTAAALSYLFRFRLAIDWIGNWWQIFVLHEEINIGSWVKFCGYWSRIAQPKHKSTIELVHWSQHAPFVRVNHTIEDSLSSNAIRGIEKIKEHVTISNSSIAFSETNTHNYCRIFIPIMYGKMADIHLKLCFRYSFIREYVRIW